MSHCLAGDDAQERELLERCPVACTRLGVPDAERVRAPLEARGTPSEVAPGPR